MVSIETSFESQSIQFEILSTGYHGNVTAFKKSNLFWTSGSNAASKKGTWKWTSTGYEPLFKKWSPDADLSQKSLNYLAYVPFTNEWKNYKKTDYHYVMCETK